MMGRELSLAERIFIIYFFICLFFTKLSRAPQAYFDFYTWIYLDLLYRLIDVKNKWS